MRDTRLSSTAPKPWPRVPGALLRRTLLLFQVNADTEQHICAKLCSCMLCSDKLRSMQLLTMSRIELQKKLNLDPSLSNISVLGVDPGAMPTDICRREGFFIRVVAMKIIMPILNPISLYFQPNGFLRTPRKSAGDVLRAAFDTATLGERPKGIYLNGTDPWPTSKEAQDEKKREDLWRDSLVLANVTKEDTALA